MQSIDCLEADESQRDTLPLLHLVLGQLELLREVPFREVVKADGRAVDQEFDFSGSLRNVRRLDDNRAYPYRLVELHPSPDI